ncbi:MAG TPA: sigma-70 family RNA polymerase sigma factor [Polyangiaceae bacterium]
MSNCEVLSEKALRHLGVVEEGKTEPGVPPGDLAIEPREPASRDVPTSGGGVDALQLEFDQVFRRYAPYVGAIVLQLIGRAADVDDVVQDVFIQAHRGLVKLRDPAAVRPWLRRIAVRRARRWLRTRWVRRWFGDSDVEPHLEPDSCATPEERAQIASVYRRLEQMPRDDRVVWVLRHVEEETLESIAELVGCSVSTVQRRLRAAQASMGEIR